MNQWDVVALGSNASPKVSQKNIHPAFFVLHHEDKPLIKSWPSDAWGSLLAFLHPASVHAEMVVTNLKVKARGSAMHEERRYEGGVKDNARNKKTERTACTRENEPDAYLLEGSCKASKFIVLFVDHRDKY